MKKVRRISAIYILATGLLVFAIQPAFAQQPQKGTPPGAGAPAAAPPSEAAPAGAAPAKKPGEASLAEKATDPTAILTQLQFQNIFTPSTYDSHGYSNTFIIQPVIPISKKGFIPTQVIRPTLPLSVSTADPDGPLGETSTIGDLVLFDIFLPERKSWGQWGLGPIFVLPTANSDLTGQGKWQVGPAFVVFYSKIKKWQLGGLVQNPISFAGDDDRPATSKFQFQPIVIRHFSKGWYAGTGDLQYSYDWLTETYNLPFNFKIGKVQKIGSRTVNLFAQPFWTPEDFQSGGKGQYGFKLNVTFLLPEINF